jgi:branched-chain amino acid transport system substrate-binding protein
MNKKTIWIIVAILIVVVIVVIIGGKSQNTSTIKIGVITDLTGSGAGLYGEPLKQGVDLALSQIDPQHKKYTAEYQDYKLDAKLALPAYEALKLKGAKLFIVDGSPALSVLAPEAKKDGNLIMNPSSFVPSYKDNNPLTCRLAVTTDTYGPAYADFVLNTLHKKNAALLLPNYEAGVALRDSITQEVSKLGGQVVQSEMYLKDDADMRTQITKIKANKQADVLVTVNYFKSANTMFSQFKDLGLNLPVVSDDWTINSNQAFTSRELVNGDYFVGYSYSGVDPKTDLQKTFYSAFKNAYNIEPALQSVQGYDITKILDAAISGARSSVPSNVANYLTTKLGDYQAVGGKISFDSDCEAHRDVVFRKVQNDNFVEVK